jgi:hypothetical protein
MPGFQVMSERAELKRPARMRLHASEQFVLGGRLCVFGKRLASREAGVELMPVHHFRLAKAPAEKHFPAIHDAAEIAKAIRAFELDSQTPELLDIRREFGLFSLELRRSLETIERRCCKSSTTRY